MDNFVRIIYTATCYIWKTKTALFIWQILFGKATFGMIKSEGRRKSKRPEIQAADDAPRDFAFQNFCIGKAFFKLDYCSGRDVSHGTSPTGSFVTEVVGISILFAILGRRWHMARRLKKYPRFFLYILFLQRHMYI